MTEAKRRGSDYGAPPPCSQIVAQFHALKSQLDQVIASMTQIVYFINEENKSLRQELEHQSDQP